MSKTALQNELNGSKNKIRNHLIMNRVPSALQQAKAALRKELKQKLAVMTDQERQTQSDIIAEKLFEMEVVQKSQRVSLYLHMKEEVQTSAILKRLLLANKECFIPYYKGSLMKMVKLESWEDYIQLPENKWKIKQPADDDVRPDALDTGGLDLILMPGLGFTRTGDRIGRGKGYYDSYLEKSREKGLTPLTIALAFNQQICETIPVGETDQKLDFVLYPDIGK